MLLTFQGLNGKKAARIKLTQQKYLMLAPWSASAEGATAHAMLLNAEGTYWSFIVDRALARRLSGCLYGAPIRLIGEGTRERDERGDWSEKT
ncbi:MAG: hypothetical protein IPI57_11140 [Candidatus Competibacteraceae bacterium]|nr:hypothetical protein [Candidatus Competibacteraceae bacterium]